jgi:hypothetical protein
MNSRKFLETTLIQTLFYLYFMEQLVVAFIGIIVLANEQLNSSEAQKPPPVGNCPSSLSNLLNFQTFFAPAKLVQDRSTYKTGRARKF